jgi:hypothetical protein
MTDQLVKKSTSDRIVKQITNSWSTQNKGVTNFFGKYDEAAYQNEVAPTRNRAIYLLGHLIAINDGMLPLFGLGERLYPELQEVFLVPDKSVAELPSLTELKQKWETLNTTLGDHFNHMKATDWLDRHNAVTQEDFETDPLRNKLNVLIGRTNHQSYHLGQLNLLIAK